MTNHYGGITMKRIIILLAAIVFCVPCCAANAMVLVSNEGHWPKSWPKELERLQKQSRTFGVGMANFTVYEIPFANRDDFESAWPHILKIEKGAPLVLTSRSTYAWLGRGKAVVLVMPAFVHGEWEGGKVKPSWTGTSCIELVVDGQIVDLNRIPLPADTPIVDQRFKESTEQIANGPIREIGPPATGAAVSTGLSVGRRLAVTPSAKILVSTGPKNPLDLGQKAQESDITEWYVHVWDLPKEGKSRVLGIQVPEGFALSPDGSWLVTTKGRAIDVVAGKEKVIAGLANVTRVCFSSDGKTLLALAGPPQDGVMRVYDWPAMKLRAQLPDQFGCMFAYAFSADSRLVALVDKERKIRIWNLETGAVAMTTEKAHSNSVRSLALSPDGKRLVSSGPKDEVWLWDATTGKHLNVLDGNQQYGIPAEMECFAFSPDSKLLVGGGLQNLVVWDVASGQVLQRFESSSGLASAAWFSPNQTEIHTIRGFHGQRTQEGREFDVYPSLHHWTIQKKKSAAAPP